MQKAADAFRTISEVADDLSLPQHVLRFWETRFPQIRPLKRAGGRRYYRPGDIALLRTIRQLLYDDGYTIKGVQRLIKEQGAKGLGVLRPVPPYEATAEAFDATADVGSADADLLPAAFEPVGDPESVPRALTGAHRRDVEDAIATVEECKRILDALVHPSG